MQTWLRANGGPLAIVLVGVGIAGFTSPFIGVGLIVFGGAWFVFGYMQRALSYARRRMDRRSRLRAPELRSALLAIRGELDSARRSLDRVLDRGRFWDPDHEHLPAEEWRANRATLSSYHAELRETYNTIEEAYQECNQLNLRVRDQVAEGRRDREAEAGLTYYPPGYEFTIDDKDQAIVTQVREQVTAALEALNGRLNGL